MDENEAKEILHLAQEKQKIGDWETAVQHYQTVLVEYPDNPDALHYLGLAYYQGKQYELALPLLERAVELNQQTLAYRKNNVFVYKKLNLINLAVRELQFYLTKKPADFSTDELLAELYHQQAENDYAVSLIGVKELINGRNCYETLQLYQEMTQVKYNAAIVNFNLGYHYYTLGDSEKAVTYYRRAIQYKFNYTSAHWNLSLALLSLGHFAEGWQEHEWRFFSNSYRNIKDDFLLQDDYYKRWQGEKIKGKTLLVIAEQGRGDAIQIIRFIKLLKQKKCRIILQTREELIPLFKCISEIDDFCFNLKTAPVFDYYLPMMSLPYIFNITEKDLLKNSKPYLFPTIEVILPATTKKFKIGFAFTGSKEHQKNTERSIPLALWQPLFNNTNIQFYNLQKDDVDDSDVLSKEIIDLKDLMVDFNHTAALIMQLDLIITADTAVAHLAGALGKPVWILISALPDWRWMRHRNDSPWYPSVRLYRQRSFRDWVDVIERVNIDLKELISK